MRFIDFKFGYEYVYSFEGYFIVKDLGKFIVKVKVRDWNFVYKCFFILFDYFDLFNLFVYEKKFIIGLRYLISFRV